MGCNLSLVEPRPDSSENGPSSMMDSLHATNTSKSPIFINKHAMSTSMTGQLTNTSTYYTSAFSKYSINSPSSSPMSIQSPLQCSKHLYSKNCKEYYDSSFSNAEAFINAQTISMSSPLNKKSSTKLPEKPQSEIFDEQSDMKITVDFSKLFKTQRQIVNYQKIANDSYLIVEQIRRGISILLSILINTLYRWS